MHGDEFTPKRFQAAVANLRTQLSGIDFSQPSESRFEMIRRKLNSRAALKADELFVLIQGIDKLTIPESATLANHVGGAVRDKTEFVNDLSLETLKLFYPSKAVDLALATGLFNLSEKAPKDITQFTGTTFTALFDSLVTKSKIVPTMSSLIRIGVGRPGMSLLLTSIYQHQKAVEILEISVGEILDTLSSFRMSVGEVLKELDQIAELIMRKDPRWSSKLLSPERSVGFIVAWIKKNKIPVETRHKHLSRLLNEYQSLIDSLKDLDAKVPERGQFWRQHLSKADRVVPRRFDGGALVGVAMWFDAYVIVEFGPIGNSAYIYQREVFEGQVLDRETWRARELVDSRIVLSGGRPGSLWHVNGWQTTANNFLNRIMER